MTSPPTPTTTAGWPIAGAVVQPLQLFSGVYYALVFFVLALVAAPVGPGGVAGTSTETARIFVPPSVVLAIVTLVL